MDIWFFAGFVTAIIVGLWVFSDAQKRGFSTVAAGAWAVGTMLILIIALPLYLLMRPKTSTKMP